MTNKYDLNPLTGELDIVRQNPVTNARASGTPGNAFQINTGDPNTMGLIIKGNTYNPAALSPTGVSGLVAWYSASSLGLAEGNAVTSWGDSSGNGLTLTNPANAPFYRANVINSKPVVRFGNGNDQLRSPLHTLNQPFTIIAVCKNSNTANLGFVVANTNGDAGLFYAGTSGKLTVYANGSNVQEASASSGFVIASGIFNGASSQLFVNGTSVATGNAGSTGMDRFFLGFANPLGLDGDIAEVAIFSGALAGTDRLGVESTFSSDYNITIAGTVPQASDLMEFEDSSGNALSRVDASGRFVQVTISGAPSGTPANGTMVYDTANNKLYVYNGGWKSVTLS